jgi:hypothetical protein
MQAQQQLWQPFYRDLILRLNLGQHDDGGTSDENNSSSSLEAASFDSRDLPQDVLTHKFIWEILRVSRGSIKIFFHSLNQTSIVIDRNKEIKASESKQIQDWCKY